MAKVITTRNQEFSDFGSSRAVPFRQLVLTVALINILACLLSVSAATNAVPASLSDLTSKLSAMGIQIEEATASRASRLAVIQTVDPGARAITSAEWAAMRDQRLGYAFHPGFTLTMSNGLPVIRQIQPGSPAGRAGLKTGDILAGAGTHPFGKISLPRARAFFTSTEPATSAVTMVRDNITNVLEVVFERASVPSIETHERLHNGFGYIKVNGLFPGTGADVGAIVRAWASNEHSGVILDLRGAAGGDEASARSIAGLFISEGQFLYAYRDHESRDLEVAKNIEAAPLSIPAMVLINRQTSGAAEMLAAILQSASKTSLLIGETTAGDFLLREPVDFDGEQILMITRMLDTADGTRFNGTFGVAPAISMSEPEWATHDYDPPADPMDRRQRMEIESQDAGLRQRVRGDGALERAVDLLVSLKSLNKPPSGVSSDAP